MRKLLDFLIRKRHWFLFFLLEIISFMLIYRSSAYQQSVLLSTANGITGRVISVSGSIRSYLYLRQANNDLLARNGDLEMEVLRLRNKLNILSADTATFLGYTVDSTYVNTEFPYTFLTAKVVNNSVTHLNNYITIDKGSKDGIAVDMGVVSDRGIVGTVAGVSKSYSIVLPVLNTKFGLSGKVLGNNSSGSISWNGRNSRYASLSELARHVEFVVGDTIVTTGYSAIFPEGIIIGTISSFRKEHDDNFYALDIELATDFNSLNNVRVISNYKQEEQRRLEKQVREND